MINVNAISFIFFLKIDNIELIQNLFEAKAPAWHDVKF